MNKNTDSKCVSDFASHIYRNFTVSLLVLLLVRWEAWTDLFLKHFIHLFEKASPCHYRKVTDKHRQRSQVDDVIFRFLEFSNLYDR